MKLELNHDNTMIVLKESTRGEYAQLKNVLTPYVENYKHKMKYSKTSWDGRSDYFKNGNIKFGLWNEVYTCCKQYGYPFDLINKEKFPRDNSITQERVEEFCEQFYCDHMIKGEEFRPYEHQIEAVTAMLKHRFCCIEVATAGGKTLIFSTVLFYLLKHNHDFKFLLIVPSIMLVTQFFKDIQEYNSGFDNENKNPLDIRIQEIMSDNPRRNFEVGEPNVCIGTYQSLVGMGTKENNPNFFKQFDVVCIDESHSAKSNSMNTIGGKQDGSAPLKSNSLTTIMDKTMGYSSYRFGMSGSYPGGGTAEMMSIESVTGPVVKVVKARELMDKGLISSAKIKCLLLNHDDLGFADNIATIMSTGGGKKAYDLEWEYVQKSERRMRFVAKLVGKFTNNSLVLFNNTDYGTEMYEYFRSNVIGKNFYYIDGKTPAKKRAYILKQMEITDGLPNVLVASYGTLSTGISIKALKNMVMAQSFKSDSRIRQSIGRLLRLHECKAGDKAIIFDLVDIFHHSRHTVMYRQYQTRVNKIYKPQEFEYDSTKIAI